MIYYLYCSYLYIYIVTKTASNDRKYREQLKFSIFCTRVVDGQHRSLCRGIDVVPEDVSCVCETRKRPIDVHLSTVMERDIIS